MKLQPVSKFLFGTLLVVSLSMLFQRNWNSDNSNSSLIPVQDNYATIFHTVSPAEKKDAPKGKDFRDRGPRDRYSSDRGSGGRDRYSN